MGRKNKLKKSTLTKEQKDKIWAKMQEEQAAAEKERQELVAIEKRRNLRNVYAGMMMQKLVDKDLEDISLKEKAGLSFEIASYLVEERDRLDEKENQEYLKKREKEDKKKEEAGE